MFVSVQTGVTSRVKFTGHHRRARDSSMAQKFNAKPSPAPLAIERVPNTATTAADNANLVNPEFLAQLTHEIRTPLNAILGFAQLLGSGSPSPTVAQQRSIDLIQQAGWSLVELMNDTVDLAAIESGRMALSLEPVALAQVMLECQALIEPQARANGVRVTFPAMSAVHVVNADRVRVQQILARLVSHEIKHSRVDGAVVVDYGTCDSARVRIGVRAVGEELSREPSATTDAEGTEVGLLLAKRLTELMGGSIGLDRTVGNGRASWFELKRNASQEHDDRHDDR